MMRRLKRRYLITNMTILSCTLIVGLAALFTVLYRSEVNTSYAVMQQMIRENRGTPSDAKRPPQESFLPTEDTQNGGFLSLANTYNSNENDPAETTVSAPQSMMQWWWMPPPYWDPHTPWEQYPPYGGWEQEGSVPWGSKQTTAPPKEEHIKPPAESQNSMTKPTHPAVSEPTGTSKTRPVQSHNNEVSETESAFSDEHTTTTKASAATTVRTTITKTSNTRVTTSTAAVSSAEPLVPVNEGHFIPDAYVAQIDNNGNIASIAGNRQEGSEEEHFRAVNTAMDSVRRSGKNAGTLEIGDNSYRFLYQPDNAGMYRLVLLDRTLELSTLSRLLLLFLLLTALGLVVMFLLSLMLANWTVTPIAAAWEKQKQFVADASHELKTPLAVISANTEVLRSNPQQSVSGASKWLSYIRSETTRMSKLITDLLAVARMNQSDDKKGTAVQISLSEIVSNTCMVFDPIVYEHGKTLNSAIQKNVMLCADEDNLRQLLSILLDNAVLHSTPAAEITVRLSQDAQGKIRLAVSNTAEDIPSEQLAHLFDRFYRVDTAGSPNGSGLGLSIAKSIVHRMGGTLTVTSENRLVTFLAALT